MTLNDSTLDLSAVMTQPTLPQPIAPADAQNPRSPAEPTPLALEEILESSQATAAEVPAIVEATDDRYYPQHWGINE